MKNQLLDWTKYQKPSRYLGGEVGAVSKDETDIRLRVALAFPDVYEIGMSHLGLKILYGLINERPDFLAERVMAPWVDAEAGLRQSGQSLASLETARPLARFDVIGFSLQYELSYTNILAMLDLAGLPLLAAERGPEAPLVIGGGPNAFNPEPLADFFDLFFLGDAEAGLLDILSEIADWKEARGSKSELFTRLAGRPGVYIPSLFEPKYSSDGRVEVIEPLLAGYESASRAIAPDLRSAYYPCALVVPYAKPVHDRIAVEISRGCTRGCRFCQAGIIYRPVRERSPESILDLARRTLAATGMSEASFLSLSAGDYTLLNDLMAAFMDEHSDEHVALSLPSLRVKSLNPEMMRQIKRVRKTGFTLAPEAGSQRLRDAINKDLTDEDLLSAAREAFGVGWRLLKLYFMIGLPTETDDDLMGIVDLVRRVKSGGRAAVNVSHAVFVPKPATPFQWEPMLTPAEMHVRMGRLRDELRRPGLQPKWNPWESSLVEGVLSRGDRRLGRVIRRVFAAGGRFDGWSEHLSLERWRTALAEEGLDEEQYLRGRDRSEVLPWSHLRTGVKEDYLWKERERAHEGTTTPDCRFGACGACGVCDFTEVRPRLCDPEADRPAPRAARIPDGEPVRFVLRFRKEDPAVLLSHLEIMEVFYRALRRAGLFLKMSQGFHPQPKMSFLTAQPVGASSLDEYLILELISPPEAIHVRDRLNRELPAGLDVVDAVILWPNARKPVAAGAIYRIETDAPVFAAEALQDALSRDQIWVEKTGKKGLRRIDLKVLLGEIHCLTPNAVEFTLYLGVSGSVRPIPAAAALFGLSEESLQAARVVKLKTLLEN